MTATLERRKQVLRLAREHNFIILEGMCFIVPENGLLTVHFPAS